VFNSAGRHGADRRRTTVDYDGRGMIWVSSPTGALRFDPAAERFTEYNRRRRNPPTAASA